MILRGYTSVTLCVLLLSYKVKQGASQKVCILLFYHNTNIKGKIFKCIYPYKYTAATLIYT